MILCTCINTHVKMYECTYTRLLYIYINTYINIYKFMHLHKCKSIYIYIYIHIYIYVYIYYTPTADNTGPLRTRERKPPPRRPTTTPKAYLTASVTRHHDHNHSSVKHIAKQRPQGDRSSQHKPSGDASCKEKEHAGNAQETRCRLNALDETRLAKGSQGITR